MTDQTYDSALARAAERCGVELRFWDIFGREHTASRSALQRIVGSLGIPTDSAESMVGAFEQRDRADWARLVVPCVIVTRDGEPLSVPITVPERALVGKIRYRLTVEDGTTLEGEAPLARAPGEAHLFEEPWVRAAFELSNDVPPGYHQLQISVAGLNAQTQLIMAPTAAYQPAALRSGGKTAGFAVALYGLRSARNWGFGDFTDLRSLCDWAARKLGVSFVALNPLHAIHNRRPYNTSPYLPNSIFFQNFLYLDIEAVPEFAECPAARQRFASPAIQRELHMLREAPYVEYERVDRLKRSFLKTLFAEFLRSHWRSKTPRGREFQEYVSREGDLLNRFALYCALDEHLRKENPDLWVWTDWPEKFRTPESAECRAFTKKHWRSVLFFKYAAWQTAVQLEAAHRHAIDAGLPLGLYHDLALATDRFGSDFWAHRDFFVSGCLVGSPPDDFSPSGQNWGFPPPCSSKHREDAFRLFRESIRKSCQFGGMLRVDHVMRFFRLYWIPENMNATEGSYVKEHALDLLHILGLESVRNSVLIVGEDLGTVEPYIRETLSQFGILSYRLFYFERHPGGRYRLPAEYPRQALVSSTTHDLPTLAGFWSGRDLEARRETGLLDEGSYRSQWNDRVREKQRMLEALLAAGLLPTSYPSEAALIPELDSVLHRAAITFLASTPSMLMVINQEDLTREPYQQNLPGTTSQYPNWGRKMRFTLEQLDDDPDALQPTAMIREILEAAGRCSIRF